MPPKPVARPKKDFSVSYPKIQAELATMQAKLTASQEEVAALRVELSKDTAARERAAIEDWLAAMPGALLVVRAEDLLGGDAPRREVLRKAARHLGLPATGLDAAALAAKEATLKPYTELGNKGLGSSRFAGAAGSLKARSPPEASEPLLPATRRAL